MLHYHSIVLWLGCTLTKAYVLYSIHCFIELSSWFCCTWVHLWASLNSHGPVSIFNAARCGARTWYLLSQSVLWLSIGGWFNQSSPRNKNISKGSPGHPNFLLVQVPKKNEDTHSEIMKSKIMLIGVRDKTGEGKRFRHVKSRSRSYHMQPSRKL